MKFSPEVEKYRIYGGPFHSPAGSDFGAFQIPGPCGRTLLVIASAGDKAAGMAWEHVSVSTPRHCPTWLEMCHVKSLFWDDEETVMQLHPKKSEWINNHSRCLHLWRPLDAEIPTPPAVAVGIKELGILE